MPKILFTEREKEIMHLILELLAAGIVLSAALVVPGAVTVLTKSYLRLQRIPRHSQRRALAEMKRRGLIRVRDSGDGAWLALTKKGRNRLQRYQLEELVIPHPRIWDGKWRLVLFDIPKKPPLLNRARDALRDRLKQLGFAKVQKSAWVHPFPCEEEIAYISESYGLRPYIRLALVQSITGEGKLRQKFDL